MSIPGAPDGHLYHMKCKVKGVTFFGEVADALPPPPEAQTDQRVLNGFLLLSE
jgi:hypothetical protein